MWRPSRSTEQGRGGHWWQGPPGRVLPVLVSSSRTLVPSSLNLRGCIAADSPVPAPCSTGGRSKSRSHAPPFLGARRAWFPWDKTQAITRGGGDAHQRMDMALLRAAHAVQSKWS